MCGSRQYLGETYCFAMCVLEEMLWIPTKSIHAAEFFHGTVEMTDKNMSFMLFKGEDEMRPWVDEGGEFCQEVFGCGAGVGYKGLSSEGLTPI